MAPRSVLIVGAGIVGLQSAYRLLRAGCEVTILDPEPPGSGCSSGNAGCISPGSVAPLGLPGTLGQVPRMLLDPKSPLSVPPRAWWSAAPWLARFAAASRASRVAEIASAMSRLVGGAVELHEQVLKEVGAGHLLRRTGQLYAYPDAAALEGDAQGWELRRRYGVRMERVDGAALRDLEPAIGPTYGCGIFLPDQGWVIDPLAASQAIAGAIAELGGIVVRDRATSLLRSGEAVVGVRGRKATYRADATVICAGMASLELLAPLGFRPPLISQRGYHVELPSESSPQLSRPVIIGDRKVFATPMASGLRLAGTVEIERRGAQANPRRTALLLDSARRIFPSIDGAEPRSIWMGNRPCFPDSLPAIGRAGDVAGLFVNLGHGHLGLTMSARSAAVLAEEVRRTRNAPPEDAWSLTRF